MHKIMSILIELKSLYLSIFYLLYWIINLSIYIIYILPLWRHLSCWILQLDNVHIGSTQSLLHLVYSFLNYLLVLSYIYTISSILTILVCIVINIHINTMIGQMKVTRKKWYVTTCPKEFNLYLNVKVFVIIMHLICSI